MKLDDDALIKESNKGIKKTFCFIRMKPPFFSYYIPF